METVKKLGLIVLIIISMCICCAFVPINIKYEFAYKIPITYSEQSRDNLPWFTVVNENYEPMFNLDSLGNYGVDKNTVEYKFDLENYSYIICYGHELKKITYRYIKPIKRKGLIPYTLTATATMSSENQNGIFIYRIKRKNITCDFHNMDNCTKYK